MHIVADSTLAQKRRTRAQQRWFLSFQVPGAKFHQGAPSLSGRSGAVQILPGDPPFLNRIK